MDGLASITNGSYGRMTAVADDEMSEEEDHLVIDDRGQCLLNVLVILGQMTRFERES